MFPHTQPHLTDLSVYFLAIVSGAVIGHLVLRTRAAILLVDYYRAKNPIIGPLLGGYEEE